MRILSVGFLHCVLLLPLTRAETIDYTDKLGRHVRIQAPVQRAVVMHFWEILPALRCWDRIVAVSSQVSSWDFMLRSIPDLSRMPSVGTGYDPNIETLLKLRPDIVITSNYRPEHTRFLEQKGLTVIALNPDSVAEMCGLIEFEGKLFDRRKEAQRVTVEMKRVFDLVKERTAKVPSSRMKKVLWLSLRPNMVGGGTGMTNDSIAMIGARNVAGGIAERSPVVPVESIIGWNPDVIFIVGNARYDKQDILGNPQWRFVKAVREKQVFKTPRWTTWSPRLALIVLWMAAKTYPELYRDIDLRDSADRFHREIFQEPLVNRELNDF